MATPPPPCFPTALPSPLTSLLHARLALLVATPSPPSPPPSFPSPAACQVGAAGCKALLVVEGLVGGTLCNQVLNLPGGAQHITAQHGTQRQNRSRVTAPAAGTSLSGHSIGGERRKQLFALRLGSAACMHGQHSWLRVWLTQCSASDALCWRRNALIATQTDDWEKGGTHQVCLCGAGSCQRCQQGRGTEAQQLRDRCTGAAAVLSQDAAAGTIRPAPRHPQSALMVLMHSEQNAPIHACCCISGSH